ncbi:MAG: 2-oxo-4-hydroxy-4-carboxy-5-ureidoimidazoline decarboxylase [Actinobacteria bacterium]|nr:2-oxo-4-hydroxy-4-carboxy-5-ureidoimidazoline decarboxylase [Actinomycetota bacterium]
MLLHQGIGLDEFNALPQHKAVHALYECVNSVPFAADLARHRPYQDHDQLFRRADALLFTLPEDSIDTILQAYPHIGRRPRSTRSHAEQCAIWDERPQVMAELDAAAQRYSAQFGFGFVMFVETCHAEDVLAAIADRMHNDRETERKVVRNELARINRTRLERMLGPEGGYSNW